MSGNSYPLGQGVKLRFAFTNASGGVGDPTTADFKVKDPSGTVTTYTLAQLTRESPGVYTKVVVADQVGRWFYRGETTDPDLEAADEEWFEVEASVFSS